MAKADKFIKDNAEYILLAILLALYVLTKSVLFALLCALWLVGVFVYETYSGARESGWRNELKEILVAVFIGVAIWYGGGFLLHTSAPLDAVVSCSMLPHMDRGDMVVLQGSEINVPAVQLSSSEWEYVKGKLQTNFTCGPCSNVDGFTPYNFSLCRFSCSNPCLLAIDGKPIFSNSSDPLFSYNYGICSLKTADGEILNDICVKSVTIKGKTFDENYGNDIVVYEPSANSVFSGSTIHRAIAQIAVEGKVYYLIKGDNNEIFDVQAPSNGTAVGDGRCLFFADLRKNEPVPSENIRGKVVARIPYVGYLKLFLWGYLETPQGCDTVIEGA